ncbi:hypothetical protein [Ornithinimicrobium cerasi]|uniref:hypothetical protein n=1 Tax=Ornithinimicrobium cerasi TaxID=2248773 RepID=UPI000EFDF21E|nr:hypothetical protein [Ornithinimicrobium cerasi]
MDTIGLWFSGVSTLLAAAALVWAIRDTNHERRLLREQEDKRAVERRQRDAAERRRQAESVAAVIHIEPEAQPDPKSWVAPPEPTGDAGWDSVLGGPGGNLMALRDRYERYVYHGWVNVHNQSSMPIYDVRVPVEERDGMVRIGTQNVVAPGQVGHIHLAPRDTRDEHWEAVTVQFRDAAGVMWHRHEDGELHEGERWRDEEPSPDDV